MGLVDEFQNFDETKSWDEVYQVCPKARVINMFVCHVTDAKQCCDVTMLDCAHFAGDVTALFVVSMESNTKIPQD